MDAATFQVIDRNGRVTHEGSESACKEWVRRTNSGFFCRIVEVEGGTPLAQQLRACLSKIKRDGSTNDN